MKDKLQALGRRWPWLGRALDTNERVGEVHGNAVASSVTLIVFVSLFPLALTAIAVVGFLAAGDGNVPNRIIDALSLQGAAADTVRNAISTAQQSRKAASIIGFGGLLWSGLGVTTAIAMAVRRPWQIQLDGMKGRLYGVLWIFGALLLGGSAVALGALLGALPDAAPKVIISIAVVALGLAVEGGFFLWTFWILGDRRVGWRSMLPGAIVGAVGFEVLKVGATVYLPRLISNLSSLYGPLGVVFAILAWLALFARLLVFASSLNAVLYERNHGTVTLSVQAPLIPGERALSTNRGGVVVEIDPDDRSPESAPAEAASDESQTDPTAPDEVVLPGTRPDDDLDVAAAVQHQ